MAALAPRKLPQSADSSAYNALVDIIVAIFPILFITKLNIAPKMKIGLSILMGGSIFAAGATIVKIYLLKDLDKHADVTWYWAPISLWYTAEVSISLSRLPSERTITPTMINSLHRWTSSSSLAQSRLYGH
ncbi:hypothetical protein O1611_g2584 [Lasiodiplodia mahajangana]|uniref:Uncharacterized protein n=1 Tax=Lasiodiplodia mahajangana TaxID=1108764 RepID=A0ACC2JU35_9PEZI|nr:hypothetical protein O1611_g2584 [Lasiodiplodia mahajangana]